ncbi:MAG: sulfite exporter TauE/SafE family protein [Thiolinea sp.]
MGEWLFTTNLWELTGLSFVVLVAGIVRGAIGFGFSALVVAACSFWLPPVAVVGLVVILEIVASVVMWKGIREDVKREVLMPLLLGGVPTILLGVWLLSWMPPNWQQLIIASYLVLVALASLAGIQLRPNPGVGRIGIVGAIAGLYNGFAGIGGVFIALFLNASRVSVRDLRATMTVYFLLCEAVFFVGAWWNGIYNWSIFMTALLAVVPMWAGIWLGSHLFNRLPEVMLRRGVLIALLVLPVLGLLKVTFG